MWKQIKNYFLERFRLKNRAELKKAFYLLLTTFTVFTFVIFMTLAHFFFWQGCMFMAGDILGLSGCIMALYFFRQGDIESAGKSLIGFVIMVFTLEIVVADFFRTDPAIRYKLYVTFVCVLCTFFLFVSFFRNIRQLVIFTVLFIGILTLHFLIILHQIGQDSQMAGYAFEHYVTVCVGTIATAMISGLLINLIEKLYTQALEQSEVIRRQNEDLRETIEEKTRFLVASNESLKEFVYLTSHDLREPLRSISGFVSLIKKKCDVMPPFDEKQTVEEYFDYVHRGVKQMEELIDDIKLYSGINMLEKNFNDVAMGDLLVQVRESIATEISNVNATVHIASGMPHIKGDKALLFALVQNLVMNAIKYQKKDTEPLIEIGFERSGGKYVFSVRDNGIGIDREYHENIFFAFKRLHGKQSEYDGTGLGLAICKKIVEIHGGRIWVDSTPDVGSVFYFSLEAV